MQNEISYAEGGDEECEPVAGMERLLTCEARSIKRTIIRLLTSTENGSVRREWQERGIVRARQFRVCLNGKLPWTRMRGSDRVSRLDEVIELLVGDAIVTPLSVVEAITQLGENVRNNGSFLRLLPQGLDKLARIAGEPVKPTPIGFSTPSVAAE